MQIIHGIKHFTPLKASVLTIGNFDGLHRGHQAIFSEVTRLASKFGVPSVAMTFHPHPMQVLAPQKGHKRIFAIEDQVEQMQRLGVLILDLEPFTLELSHIGPEEFLLEYIVRSFAPKAIVVGYDFNFGANRTGTIEFLQDFGKRHNIEVHVITEVLSQNLPISSSRIRQEVQAGNLPNVRALLGRNYYYESIVIEGDKRGRTIGFPTANLQLNDLLLPPAGVYAGYVQIDGKKYSAVCNIGTKPTFHSGVALTFEVHILAFSQDLYGKKLRFEFVDRLRTEKKFASIDELVNQIKADVAKAQEIL